MNDAQTRSYGNSCFRPVQLVRYLLHIGGISLMFAVVPLPSVNVHLPKDRISMAHQGFGFCEFLTEEDAEYACKIMNQIKLWGKPIRVNKVRNRPPLSLDTGLGIRSNAIVSAGSYRPLRTRSNSTWARISSSVHWTKMWTNGCFMTHSARSA